MPIYEYECSNCKFYVEALQKISEPPLVKCPSCKKQTLKRLVSAPVFRLKGGGWYETDFKSDQEDKRNLAKDEEAPPADKPADDKAKPEKPAEAAKDTDKKPARAASKKAASRKAARPTPRAKTRSKAKPKAARSAKRRR